jgi:flagellum-specific peptidoglycan hydrolase FlgJ
MEKTESEIYTWSGNDANDVDASTESTSPIVSAFLASYRAEAQASQAASTVPALVTLAQAALESGWGVHAPRFNFFGIKAKASDPEPSRQLLKTREVLPNRNYSFPEIISITARPDGQYEYIVRDWFRAYANATAAFNAHAALLRGKPRYAAAFAHVADPYKFADAIADAGYATDPHYKVKLRQVMTQIERTDVV